MTNQDLEADAILERFRETRILRPIARVRAWEKLPREFHRATAAEVHGAWKHFKRAQAVALAGGPTDSLLELHDEFTSLLGQWLDGPAA